MVFSGQIDIKLQDSFVLFPLAGCLFWHQLLMNADPLFALVNGYNRKLVQIVK